MANQKISWNFSNVNGWQGLKPSNKDNQLVQKLPHNNASPPAWDSAMLSKSKVDELVTQQNSASSTTASAQNIIQVREKIAWNVALGPVKSLPMTGFMFYMSGSQLSIFPIMMFGMQMMKILKSLFQYPGQAFEGNEQKILLSLFWIFGQFLCFCLCVWQCNRMGLLPTHPADWLTFAQPAVATEVRSKNYL